MSLNIVLEASHNFNNKFGKNIWELSNKICNIIEDELKYYDCNIYRLDDINGNIDKTLYEKSKYLDEINPDIYLLIDFNSDKFISEKKGMSIYTNISSENNLKFTNILNEKMTTGIKPYLSYIDIKVLNSTYSLCRKDYNSAIIIGPYITNIIESDYINSHEGINQYSLSIINSIISFLNLTRLNCKGIINIDKIYNKDIIMNNNYIIKEIDGKSVAIEKNNLPLSILERSNNSLYKFVVRRNFDDIGSEKIKTDNVSDAIKVCDELLGYSVFSTDGNLIYKSNKGYINNGNISKSDKYATISKLGGAILKTNMFEEKTLQLGTKVKIIDIKNSICSVEVLYNNEYIYGNIDSKYLNF